MRCACLLLVLAVGATADDAATVAKYAASLATGDARARTRAVKQLAKFDMPAAHDALEAALEDKDATVRTFAAAGLLRRFPKHAVARGVVVSALGGGDWYTAWQACLTLRRLGPGAVDAVPALLNAARDEKADVGQEALNALAAIAPDDPSVLLAFQHLLASKRKLERRAILAHLAKHKSLAPARPWLAGELRANAYGLRSVAFDHLVDFGMTALQDFAEVLADGPVQARLLAAEGLGGLEHKDAAAPLAAALTDEVAGVRVAAARALGKLGPVATSQADALAKALADDDRAVVLAIVRALDEIGAGTRVAEAPLIRLLAKPDRALAEAVLKTLARYPGSMASFLRARWEHRTIDGEKKRVWRVRIEPRRIGGDSEDTLEALRHNKYGPPAQEALRAVLAPDLDADLRALLAKPIRPERRILAAELLVELSTDRAAARAAIEAAATDRRAAVRDAMQAILDRWDEK